MESRLILFDVDGTLIDTAGAGRRAMEHAFTEIFAVEGIARQAGGVRYAGRTDHAILEDVAGAMGVARDVLAARAGALHRCYVAALSREMERPDPRRRVLPGVRPLLDHLARRAGVHIGLLTGNLEEGARIKLAAFGLNGYFAGGGFSVPGSSRRDVAHAAWRRLCGLCGVEFAARSVVVVGDTEHDVDCARAHGFRAVAVHSGWVDRDVLAGSRPDALLDQLGDDPGVLDALLGSDRDAT